MSVGRKQSFEVVLSTIESKNLHKHTISNERLGLEMTPRSKSYQEDLLKALEDPLEAQAYLNAALEDEDPNVFLLALKDVAEAKLGGMKQLADETKLNQESLYRMLSEQGNPKLTSLNAILSSLGFRLTVERQTVIS